MTEDATPQRQVVLEDKVVIALHGIHTSQEGDPRPRLESLADEIVDAESRVRDLAESERPRRRAGILRMLQSLQFVDGSEFDRRMAMCRACEHHRYAIGDCGDLLLQCAACGCLMAVKARFSQAHCPIGAF